jgi:hypothetical protein
VRFKLQLHELAVYDGDKHGHGGLSIFSEEHMPAIIGHYRKLVSDGTVSGVKCYSGCVYC